MKTSDSLHGMPSYESVGVPGVRAWASRREAVRVDAAMARGHGALPRAGTRGLSQAGRIHSIYTMDIYSSPAILVRGSQSQAADVVVDSLCISSDFSLDGPGVNSNLH